MTPGDSFKKGKETSELSSALDITLQHGADKTPTSAPLFVSPAVYLQLPLGQKVTKGKKLPEQDCKMQNAKKKKIFQVKTRPSATAHKGLVFHQSRTEDKGRAERPF